MSYEKKILLFLVGIGILVLLIGILLTGICILSIVIGVILMSLAVIIDTFRIYDKTTTKSIRSLLIMIAYYGFPIGVASLILGIICLFSS